MEMQVTALLRHGELLPFQGTGQWDRQSLLCHLSCAWWVCNLP